MRMRVAASVVLTVLVATVLTACQFITPQQTSRSYTPSDGVNGQVGDIAIRNVFLVTDTGTRASLIGALANEGSTARTVTMQYTANGALRTVRVAVPAGGLVTLRPTTSADQGDGTTRQVVLSGIDATLGGLFRVGFGAGSSTPVSLSLPVLTGSLPDYTTLTPSPVPTETPTSAVVPTDGATPLPTDTGSTLSPTQAPAP